MQKSSWVNTSDDNYNSLIQDVTNNLNNKNYQTTVYGQMYDFNQAKHFLSEMSIKNICKNKAQKM